MHLSTAIITFALSLVVSSESLVRPCGLELERCPTGWICQRLERSPTGEGICVRLPLHVPLPIRTTLVTSRASRTTTTTTTTTPKSTPTFQSCGGFRVNPATCPKGHICVDNPYVEGCGMACDKPGICVDPGEFCGGFAGFRCKGDRVCIDDPRDDCDPRNGGADCGGICV
ncbi:uncharacterized protein PODANS_0_800 [Podospora anserina S mat+]|uniref:Podospora anserina S mat+ genomic DNA chromosome 2, supercontig 1 n=1 Tax=Podospora anserina (strain S / ATCC MYA-4624 / DSM 980 / FGSC 10383) TaxID=515849 RepID=B2ABQ9_PODAN|nr:uncharacterized protein PODANS_0_800 [Podospora anserina S mat+]CAP60897.1 unnamed protein product [Podospora anserina S mat+]CDP24911.1 Putative protein of unknown function [Podospora anserina S mat+]